MMRAYSIVIITCTVAIVAWVAVEAQYLKPVGSAASARPYIALADYAMDLKAFDAAYDFYTEASNRTSKNNVETGKAMTNLAVLCGDRGEWSPAKAYLEKALRHAPGLDMPRKRLEWLRQNKPYLF